ncbi:deoxyuridine 5'-triphosphate nucleotidohydrolase [Halopenitus persicus]|uniref:deoxyuridine 5'-triphosphate nucleotidohydrolase n=1 Tax=Halopenitus persicus TaxID=1048396 RepID=UPI000BBAC90A|nr:deoxyuridine 5'-triphosphate nucleotidohydrolase [Halopenitus persicus]
MFESGANVARALEAAGADLDPAQVQPNGVDLTLGGAFRQTEPGHIGRDGKTVGDREPLAVDGAAEDGDGTGNGTAEDGDGTGNGDVYRFEPGAYVVEYGEPVRIPEGHVGFVYPRSSLLRNSCMLNTAVWDAGYEGVGEGLLQVGRPITIERDARIAQLVLAEAAHEDTYDGAYQGEGL